MKKYTLLLIIAFISGACNDPSVKNSNRGEVYDHDSPPQGSTFHTVVIDSCEYVIWDDFYRKGGITHKGNCKNHYNSYKTR
jgi:hypothetical protein